MQSSITVVVSSDSDASDREMELGPIRLRIINDATDSFTVEFEVKIPREASRPIGGVASPPPPRPRITLMPRITVTLMPVDGSPCLTKW
jgi:hypothetical protein